YPVTDWMNNELPAHSSVRASRRHEQSFMQEKSSTRPVGDSEAGAERGSRREQELNEKVANQSNDWSRADRKKLVKFQLFKAGAQGRNRTTDTVIFRLQAVDRNQRALPKFFVRSRPSKLLICFS